MAADQIDQPAGLLSEDTAALRWADPSPAHGLSMLACLAVTDVCRQCGVGAREAVRLLTTVAAQQRDDKPGRAAGQDLPVPARGPHRRSVPKRRPIHEFEDAGRWSSARGPPTARRDGTGVDDHSRIRPSNRTSWGRRRITLVLGCRVTQAPPAMTAREASLVPASSGSACSFSLTRCDSNSDRRARALDAARTG